MTWRITGSRPGQGAAHPSRGQTDQHSSRKGRQAPPESHRNRATERRGQRALDDLPERNAESDGRGTGKEKRACKEVSSERHLEAMSRSLLKFEPAAAAS